MTLFNLGLLSLALASDLFYYNLTAEPSIDSENIISFEYTFEAGWYSSFSPEIDSDAERAYPVLYNETSHRIQGFQNSLIDPWYLTTSNNSFNYTYDITSAAEAEVNDGYLSLNGSDQFKVCTDTSSSRYGIPYFYTPAVGDITDNCTDIKIKAAKYDPAPTLSDYALFNGNVHIISNNSEFDNSTFGANMNLSFATNNSDNVDVQRPLVYNYETKEVRSSTQ